MAVSGLLGEYLLISLRRSVLFVTGAWVASEQLIGGAISDYHAIP